jgi:hypothetical protein
MLLRVASIPLASPMCGPVIAGAKASRELAQGIPLASCPRTPSHPRGRRKFSADDVWWLTMVRIVRLVFVGDMRGRRLGCLKRSRVQNRAGSSHFCPFQTPGTYLFPSIRPLRNPSSAQSAVDCKDAILRAEPRRRLAGPPHHAFAAWDPGRCLTLTSLRK